MQVLSGQQLLGGLEHFTSTQPSEPLAVGAQGWKTARKGTDLASSKARSQRCRHEVLSLILVGFVCTSLTGFDHPIDDVMEDLLGTLDDPALPLLQWSDSFSSAAARLPSLLADQLEVRTGLTGL